MFSSSCIERKIIIIYKENRRAHVNTGNDAFGWINRVKVHGRRLHRSRRRCSLGQHGGAAAACAAFE